MNMPCISVIIPFFNPGEKLKKSIDSVIFSNSPKVEIIAWNDGSNDQLDYQEICRGYPSVIYKREENIGVSGARNMAVGLAKGDYLLFLDSDDWMEPNGITDFLEIVEKDPALELIFSWSRLHDIETNQTEDWKKFHQMTFAGKTITYSNLCGTFLLKREVFNRVGGYNSKLRFSENLDLMIRVLSLDGLKISHLKKITVNFGNSLNKFTRNRKFSQIVLLQSLTEFYASNLFFFRENQRFAENVICRMIVASIFLRDVNNLKHNLRVLKKMQSSRYPKYYLLSKISFAYRHYLSYQGFRA